MADPKTPIIIKKSKKAHGGHHGGSWKKDMDGSAGTGISPDELVRQLKTTVHEKLTGFKDQVFIDTVEGGISVQIVDNVGGIMFKSGSPEPTARAREIIRLVSENIKHLPNRIAVEGHTDAAPIRSGISTNWELSSARASSARRELELNGIDPSRIARVVGYADQELYNKDDPYDPRNRRISIILLMPEPKAAN